VLGLTLPRMAREPRTSGLLLLYFMFEGAKVIGPGAATISLEGSAVGIVNLSSFLLSGARIQSMSLYLC